LTALAGSWTFLTGACALGAVAGALTVSARPGGEPLPRYLWRALWARRARVEYRGGPRRPPGRAGPGAPPRPPPPGAGPPPPGGGGGRKSPRRSRPSPPPAPRPRPRHPPSPVLPRLAP